MLKPPATFQRTSNNAQGALWMLASAATFTGMTVLVKFLGVDYSAALQTFYRQAASLLVLLPLILKNPRRAFASSRPGILIFRAGAGTLGAILAFYSYQKMPLADANALSFTRTLWIVPLAALVLHERVGPRRIAATVVGFGGVLLILQPSAQMDLGWPAIAALFSAVLLALTVTGMKAISRDHSTTTLMSWSAALGLAFSIPGALLSWRWPPVRDLLLLACMGVLGTITQACYMKGIAAGEAAVMAPIDYTRLIFAVVIGLLVFHDAPNGTTLLGSAIVMLATLYITLRETKLDIAKPPGQET